MTKLALWFWAAMGSILLFGLTIYWWSRPVQPAIAAAATAYIVPSVVVRPTIVPPTATPTPLRFAARSQIGNVDISGMTADEARRALQKAYAPALAPLTLSGDAGSTIITAAEIDLTLPLDASLDAAIAQAADTLAVQVPLTPTYDVAKLHTILDDQSALVNLSPTLGLDRKTWTFVLTPGLALNVDATLALITHSLELSVDSRRIVLTTEPITNNLRATPDQLLAALAAREKKWGGILGVSVHNLATNETIHYHGDTSFSGMSVIKIAILLQTYISEPKFTKQQRNAIELMISKSYNEESNELLAMIGDGDGLDGVQIMNATLRDVLGLRGTLLEVPFESSDYLIKRRGLDITAHGREGAAPFTDADLYIRATPNEMTTLLTAIVECAAGAGPLLEIEGTALSAERCTEILDVLSRNEDTNKIVAGVPKTAFVAHKSGWIDDTRADAGYVRPINGDPYVVSMWMWDTEYIETDVSDPLLASVSRLVYTAQNPQIVGK